MNDRYLTPRDRHHYPLLDEPAASLKRRFAEAIASKDLEAASFAFLELRFRRPKSAWVRNAMRQFAAIDAQPIEWLGVAHAVAREFRATARGWGNVYMVLLDTRDHRARDWGVYVGETRKTPERRYAEHRAGVRDSGRVRRLGAGLLRLPVRHLRRISCSEARSIEAGLHAALSARGIVAHGGH